MLAISLLPYSIAIGILVGLYYALMALGLNMVFGVVRMVNIAHGDIIMLASYVAYFFLLYYRINVGLSLIISFPLFFVVGVLVYYAFVPRLQSSNDPEMNSFAAFFGL
ncbi:MAG: branched-chain amino acid ABC transporter permease, partial [Caldisphaera sp.]|nr:branched-chain amino acid ABC transporter permease [Caldisphaera sp.]